MAGGCMKYNSHDFVEKQRPQSLGNTTAASGEGGSAMVPVGVRLSAGRHQYKPHRAVA